MIELTTIGVMLLAGQKVIPETRTPEPFEWAGELLAMIVVLTIGLSIGLSLHVAFHGPTFQPDPIPPFQATTVAPPSIPGAST